MKKNYNTLSSKIITISIFIMGFALTSISGYAQMTNINVLINGGAENSGDLSSNADLPQEWVGNMRTCSHTWCGIGDDDSNRLFYGGDNIKDSYMYQDVAITSLSSDIENQRIKAVFSLLLGGYAEQTDKAAGWIEFLDESDAIISTSDTLGPCTNVDRENETKLMPYTNTFLIPIGTKKVRVYIRTYDFDGSSTNDGYVDDISLIFTNELGIELPKTNNLIIYSNNKDITIEGLNYKEPFVIINSLGQIIKQGVATSSTMQAKMPASGIYFVNGTKVFVR